MIELFAFGSSASSHVRFTPSFSSSDGSKVLDEISGSVTIFLPFVSADGSQVEFAAVVDYNKGGLGELNFLQAVQQLLKKSGRSFSGDDDISGNVFLGNKRVGHAGCSSSLSLFKGLFCFDCLIFHFEG